MKKFTATASVAFLGAFTGSAFAGGLNDAVTETRVAAPDICAPSRSFEIRGGALRSENVWKEEVEALGPAADKVGLGDAEGGFADMQYRWDRCDSDLTFSGGVANTTMSEFGEDGPSSLGIDDEATLAHLDFTYGRPLGERLRYFGGLRVMQYDSVANLDRDFVVPSDNAANASFTGAGPIAGVTFRSTIPSRGQFGFFGGASAAAIFGSQTNTIEGDLFVADTTTQDSNETIMSFDAELGMFYGITDNSEISLGLSYQRLNDIDFVSGDLGNPDGATFDTGDREFSGVFVGYSARF